MKHNKRLLLILTVLISTTHAFGQPGQKYPYVDEGDTNGPVIVSRDDNGGVHPDALAGDAQTKIEALLQVKSKDELSFAVSWDDANKACVYGWRLPTKRELQLIWLMGGAKSEQYSNSIINEDNSLSRIGADDFAPLEQTDYWTSTADGWYVSFVDGKTASDITTDRRVRCVKSEGDIAGPSSGTYAHSNIVLQDDKLVFATRREGVSDPDNHIYTTTAIPANSQGLHFRFGSLIGMNFTSTDYPSEGHIAFKPKGYNTNIASWAATPYVTNSFSSYAQTNDHMIELYPDSGYDIAEGKGDICRYISDQGWVEGRWRLPTAQEIGNYAASSAVTAGQKGGSFGAETIYDATGNQQLKSGRWLGPDNNKVTTSGTAHMQTPPTDDVRFFPTGGFRNYSSGALGYSGQYGHGRSSTASTSANGFYLAFTSSASYYPNSNYRGHGFTVRCVAE